MTITTTTDQDTRRKRTVVWVVALATIGLIFDGYDLVVYGAVVSTFLKDPSQLGEVTPALAGTLGSYALLGMMFGALLAGAFGDILGRRKVMLIAYAWFSIGMFITALMSTTTTFGVMRFLTGLGHGRADRHHRHPGHRNRPAGEEEPLQRDHLLRRAAGQPAGCSSCHPFLGLHRLARTVHDRGAADLDAVAVGVLKMPESVPWLVARGQIDKARAVSERTGVPMPDSVPQSEKAEKVGFAGLFSRGFLLRDGGGGIDGRPRPVPQLLPQHVVAGVDGTGGVQYQGLARLPPRVEWRRNHRGAGRLPVRRPVRAQTGCGACAS